MASGKKEKLSSSLEDYLETIFNLTAESDVARSKDIAEELGVSRSSVTGALRVLKRKGLANYEPYGYVTLTEDGKVTAENIARKHEILKSFFVDVLGISTDVGQEAACRAEHSLGSEVIDRLLSFIQFITGVEDNGDDLRGAFSRFCEKKPSGYFKDQS